MKPESVRQTGADIEVVNRCRTADGQVDDITGVAKVVPDSGNAKLRVSFFRPFYGDYWVLALAPDYRWALIGNPDRSLAWVFARDPVMDDATLTGLQEKLRAYGYDPAALKRVPQTPDQLPASD